MEERPFNSLELGKVTLSNGTIYVTVHFDNLNTLIQAIGQATIPYKLWLTASTSPPITEIINSPFENGTN